MTQPHEYPTAQGFRRALLAHLRQRATDEQVDPQRLQRLVAFDRFLARLLNVEHIPWLVKGGYAMELRLHGRARATQDIDLAIPRAQDLRQIAADPMETARAFLQDAVERDLNDRFTFLVGEPKQELDGPPYGGVRFKIEARIGGETFTIFQLDLSIGDVVLGTAEWRTGESLLDFAGITPVRVPVLPAEQQFAEKLHALTLPRGGMVNTRVKDLADLVLLIELGQMDTSLVATCARATFSRRATHALPDMLEAPPQQWGERYAALADECGLQARTLDSAFSLLSEYCHQTLRS